VSTVQVLVLRSIVSSREHTQSSRILCSSSCQDSMEPYTCKTQERHCQFHNHGQLKEHQITQPRRFPCAHADCPIICGGGYDPDRHDKNQHEFFKEVCPNGCRYVQRRDNMQAHLKSCHFGQGIFYIYPQDLD
jgi:hypothetical protein